MNTPFNQPNLSSYVRDGTNATLKTITFPDGTTQTSAAGTDSGSRINGVQFSESTLTLERTDGNFQATVELNTIVDGNDTVVISDDTIVSAIDGTVKTKVDASGLHILSGATFDGYNSYNAQPRFSAYSTEGGQTFAGYINPVVLNKTFYNVGSCYSTSTGIFTVPVPGHYRFTITAYNSSNSNIQMALWYKGVGSANFVTMKSFIVAGEGGGNALLWTVNNGQAINATFDIPLSVANSQVTFGGKYADSVTLYRSHTFFSGELISAT